MLNNPAKSHIQSTLAQAVDFQSTKREIYPRHPAVPFPLFAGGGDPFTIEYQKAVPFIHMEIHWVWIRLPQGNTRVCACVFLCFRSSFSAWLKGNFVGCCAWFSHGQVFSIPEVRFGCDFSCKCSFGFVANPLDGK